MGKTDITIDVVNIDKVMKILRHAYESAEKFVKKVESGKARSVETYADMKSLMNLIALTGSGIPVVTDKKNQEFKDSVMPAIQYLCENHHPHCTIIVTPTGAELVEGLKHTGQILKYLRD